MASTSGPSQPFTHMNALLTSSLRARATDSIRPFEDQLVRSLQRETRALHEQLELAREEMQKDDEEGEGGLKDNEGVICGLSISALTARRNKRVLLAYAMQRRNAILDAYWATGASMPALLSSSNSNVSSSSRPVVPPDAANGAAGAAGLGADTVSKVLTPSELDYIRAHASLVTDLARPYRGYSVALTGSLARGPPRELYVQVKCVRELGEVVVGEGGGTIRFEEGSRYFVKRADVERLIEGGWLEEVEA